MGDCMKDKKLYLVMAGSYLGLAVALIFQTMFHINSKEQLSTICTFSLNSAPQDSIALYQLGCPVGE